MSGLKHEEIAVAVDSFIQRRFDYDSPIIPLRPSNRPVPWSKKEKVFCGVNPAGHYGDWLLKIADISGLFLPSPEENERETIDNGWTQYESREYGLGVQAYMNAIPKPERDEEIALMRRISAVVEDIYHLSYANDPREKPSDDSLRAAYANIRQNSGIWLEYADFIERYYKDKVEFAGDNYGEPFDRVTHTAEQMRGHIQKNFTYMLETLEKTGMGQTIPQEMQSPFTNLVKGKQSPALRGEGNSPKNMGLGSS